MTAHASSQLRRLRWGAIATLIVTALAAAIWGRAGVTGAAAFGAVATALQIIAARAMERTGIPAALDHLGVYGLGVVLRMSGVLLLGVAIGLDRATFPPLPAAFGYLGTILPLLYLETRLGR